MGKNLICYCFGYSEDDIARDVRDNNGDSTIRQRIIDEKMKGACRCGTFNPLGR